MIDKTSINKELRHLKLNIQSKFIIHNSKFQPLAEWLDNNYKHYTIVSD